MLEFHLSLLLSYINGCLYPYMALLHGPMLLPDPLPIKWRKYFDHMLGIVGQVGCGLESFDNIQQDQLTAVFRIFVK